MISALQFVFAGIEALEDAHPSLLAAPWVVDYGVECERARFDDRLADGSLTLERTTRWLRSAIEREVGTVSLFELLGFQEAAFVQVHSTALVALVVDSAETLLPAACPETLLLDVDRLETLRQEFRQTVAALTLSVSTTRFLMENANLMADRPVLLEIQAHLADARPLDNLRATASTVGAMLLRSTLGDDARALCVRAVFASVEGDALHSLM